MTTESYGLCVRNKSTGMKQAKDYELARYVAQCILELNSSVVWTAASEACVRWFLSEPN